jgi:putative DNA primase/helicase
VRVLTGGGGDHTYFRLPAGVKFKAKIADGVDVRADAVVIAPPSVHASGDAYQWSPRCSPEEVQVQDAPAWLLELATVRDASPAARRTLAPETEGTVAAVSREDRLKRASAYLAKKDPAISGSGGHRTAWSAALSVTVGFDLSEDEAYNLLVTEYNPRCDPPWSEKELRHKVSSAAKNSQKPRGWLLRTPRDVRLDGAPHVESTASPPASGEPSAGVVALTDIGNAREFVTQNEARIRYVPAWKKWLVYDGQRWAADDKLQVQEFVIESAMALFARAARGASDALHRHAKKSASRGGIDATLALARSDARIAVAQAELDRDEMLLNVRNGTLDLRSGALRSHRREDLLTKIAPVAFDPSAKSPTWDAFVDRVLGGDVELVEYMRRAVGYALTGDVSEQCLFFLHGGGKNGKSTFVNVLLELLGDYAIAAAPNLLMAKSGDAHPTAEADLFGKRFVVCQETEQGKKWGETTVKQLTGGDAIRARRMREDYWQFAPTHKFFVTGNHKPAIVGTDEGIWRRLNLVPFEVTIPESERDPHLMDKLRAELPGILNWALAGCAAWRGKPLSQGKPARVSGANERYRREQDLFGDFLADACTLEPEARISRKELRSMYEDWCKETGAHPLGAKQLAERLRERGCGEAKMRIDGDSAKAWQGIRKQRMTDPDCGHVVRSDPQISVNPSSRSHVESEPENGAHKWPRDHAPLLGVVR